VDVGDAVSSMVPAAVGLALSPLPIVAVVALLGAERGRANAVAYLAGQLGGTVVLGAILLGLAGSAGAAEETRPADWVSVVKLLLGALLLFLAAKQLRERPSAERAPSASRWLRALDGATPVEAAGLGAALGTINPKNLVLVVAGMAAIAETGISSGQQAIAVILFACIGATGVAVPLVVSIAVPERSSVLLSRLQAWLGRHGGVIVAVVLILVGAKLVGDAMSDLWL